MCTLRKWTNELQWENVMNEYILKHWGNIKTLSDKITSQAKDLWIIVHKMGNGGDMTTLHAKKFEESLSRMKRIWRWITQTIRCDEVQWCDGNKWWWKCTYRCKAHETSKQSMHTLKGPYPDVEIWVRQ